MKRFTTIILIVIGFIILSSPIAAQDSSYDMPPDLTGFYWRVNEKRLDAGLSRLDRAIPLEALATFYAGLCAHSETIDHYLIDNEELYSVAQQYDVKEYAYVGEVLQYGPVSDMEHMGFVLNRFMNSPPHRDVLMHPDGVDIGAGYIERDGVIYFTAYVGRY